VAKIATLPGVRSPFVTTVAGDLAAPQRKRRDASSGIQASGCTPSSESIRLRANFVLLIAFTVCTTIGMPANWPCTSVLARNFSPPLTPPFLNLMALARSIRCGKSRFHACGGVYGHLVM